MSQWEIFEPTFTKITENLLGAEGPVFDKYGNFFMVAPEVMDGQNYAGEVLKIDLETGKVRCSREVIDKKMRAQNELELIKCLSRDSLGCPFPLQVYIDAFQVYITFFKSIFRWETEISLTPDLE